MAWRRPPGKRDCCFAEHCDLQPELLWPGAIRRRLAVPSGHIPLERADAWSIPSGRMPTPHFRSRFHEHRLRRPPRNKSRGSPVSCCEAALASWRRTMRKFDSKRSTYKAMIVVAASLALGTAMMATATIAFARRGGGGGGHFGGGFGGGHFGGFGGGRFGGFGGGHFGGGFGDGRFAGRHFGRGFGDGFGRLYGFGGAGLYDGDGDNGCYVLTPYGYAWA